MGGVQWRRNFGVRPDLVVYPMPQFSADATVPSSVELYVNNVRLVHRRGRCRPVRAQSIPARRRRRPAVVGSPTRSGEPPRPASRCTPTTRRLAQGLSDFLVRAGVYGAVLYGSDSDDYGDDVVANASWRRGLSDELTVELARRVRPGCESRRRRHGLVTARAAMA
jgi:outer membrane usher protein